MAIDPRLASPLILALAARRATARQPASQVRWITWEDRIEEEALQPAGLSLPMKAESPEAWAAQMRRQFGSLREAEVDHEP